MNDPVASPGARLKAERERRNISLEKAGNTLHLDSWVVEALESDNYPGVGPSVYVKGHLKRYAEMLELPVAEILAGYHSGAQTPQAPAPQPSTVRVPTGATPQQPVTWPFVAALAAALVLLGVLWWKPWHHRAAAPPGAVSHALDDRAAPAAAPAVPAPAPASNAAARPSEADAAPGSGRARLRLSFSADSWVEVHDAEGRRAYAGNGRANSVKTIAGDAPMRVYLSSASGVQLEINNRAVAIGAQFVDGKVARFEAGADGVLRRDSGVAARSAQTPTVRPTG